MSEVTCSVDGCDKPQKYRYTGYCIAHHARYLRNGDPGVPEVQDKSAPKQQCSVLSCTTDAVAKGMCHHHWRRVRRHGDPEYVTPSTGQYNNYWHGDNIGIGAAHDRVRAAKGAATQHQCVDCGQAAKQWAYDHTDPSEKVGDNHGCPCPYSVDPAYYQPMCVPCHKRFDLAHIKVRTP